MSEYKLVPGGGVGLTDEQIFDIAEPFGAFEFGDAQGGKTLAFERAILAAAPAVQGEPVALPTDAQLVEIARNLGALPELCGTADHPDLSWHIRTDVRNMVREALKLYAAPQPAEQQPDPFRGDNAALIRSAQSLLSLDDKGAFGPNGIGGHARNIITDFIARFSADQQPAPDVTQLVEALSGLLRSLCIHEGEDVVGRVKGTWSVEAEEAARAALAAHRKGGCK